MNNHLVDIKFNKLERALRFVSVNEIDFMMRGAPFDYKILVPSGLNDIYIVSCWIRSEDIEKLDYEDDIFS